MKKLKLMSFITVLLITLGCSFSNAQIVFPTGNNITRPACISGLSGCVSESVILTLSTDPTPVVHSASNTYIPLSSYSSPTNYKHIAVAVGSHTSAGSYVLPVSLTDPTVVIPESDNTMYPYTVVITMTAANQYTISVSNLETGG